MLNLYLLPRHMVIAYPVVCPRHYKGRRFGRAVSSGRNLRLASPR